MAEQLHLLLDGPFRNRLARRHPMLEQRAPEFEVVGGEVAIGDGNASQRFACRCGAVAFGRGE